MVLVTIQRPVITVFLIYLYMRNVGPGHDMRGLQKKWLPVRTSYISGACSSLAKPLM